MWLEKTFPGFWVYLFLGKQSVLVVKCNFFKGCVNPKMIQFCLRRLECTRKVLHQSFIFFFRYKCILTWEITPESSLRPPFWLRHLCCDITNGISAHQKSKTSLRPLQACVLSSLLQKYFLVLTMVKQCVVGSCNKSKKGKIKRKNSAPVD